MNTEHVAGPPVSKEAHDAGRLKYLESLNSLRQEAGITAAMLRDGRAKQLVEDVGRLRSLLTCGGCGMHYGDPGYLDPCPNAHREKWSHEWQTKRERWLADKLVQLGAKP